LSFKEGLKRFVGIKTEEDLKKEKTTKEKAKEFVESLLFAAIAAFFIITFVVQNTRIPTGSMEGTILVGDFVLVNKFIYGSTSPRYIPFTEIQLPFFRLPSIREPRPKDIVVFEYPGDKDELYAGESKRSGSMERGTNYVKRLIGMPGDVIQVKDKVVFVNGKEFFRPPYIQYLAPIPRPASYTNPMIFPSDKPWNEDNYGPLRVPKKGDVIPLNLSNVEEWRIIIDREYGKHVVDVNATGVTIEGKAVTSYTMKKDYYFMMGDNRDDSMDSRFWGFVSRDIIVGQAFITLFSWDRDIPFTEFVKLIGSIRPDRVLRLLN
jgi:signal peptidase I